MTGLWSVIIPESAEVTNLITNPSFETGVTNWTHYSGGVLSQSSVGQRRGVYAMYCECTTSVYDGVNSEEIALTSGTTYTFAIDINTFLGNSMLLTVCDSAYTDVTNTTFTGTSDWTREVLTYSATATANFRFTIKKNNFESTTTIVIDGAGVYALDHDPGHIDGDQDDCWWNGTPHASTSTRKAGSATGGEVTNFDDLSFYIKEFPGSGMANVDPLLQEIGKLPGSIDAGEKVTERVLTLVGHLSGSSQTDLHAKRKALINAVKSDRVPDKQQVKLVYSGGNSERPTRISAKYVGGLSMGMQDGFTEPIALKFLATDPFWYEDGDEGAVLVYNSVVTDGDYVVKRVNNDWTNINTAFNSWVTNLVKSNGKIYIGGYFTDVGDANGDYIVSYDGSALASLGTGVNDYVRALAVSPTGNIYAAGYFTSAGGVANTQKIAYWDTSTAAWKEVGGGLANSSSTDERVHALAFDDSGSLYVGGIYTGNTSTDLDNISVYSATGWGALTTGLTGAVYGITKGPDGYMYMAGDFDAAGGDTDCVNVAYWTGSAWGHLGTGTLGGVANYTRAICFDDAGNLYIGGDFSSIDGVSAANIAKWNGNQWSALGTGLSGGLVYSLQYHNGLLYAAGDFTGAGGITLNLSVAVWNGSSWVFLPLIFPSAYIVYAILVDDQDDIYIGGTFSGDGGAAEVNTLTNTGTASTYPTFYFKRSGGTNAKLTYIKNETTGATLWFDYSLQDGESLTINTAPDKKSVTSSFRGSVIGEALLRGSQFTDFVLLPGANSVSVKVDADATATVTSTAWWPITHWSLDGSST